MFRNSGLFGRSNVPTGFELNDKKDLYQDKKAVDKYLDPIQQIEKVPEIINKKRTGNAVKKVNDDTTAEKINFVKNYDFIRNTKKGTIHTIDEEKREEQKTPMKSRLPYHDINARGLKTKYRIFEIQNIPESDYVLKDEDMDEYEAFKRIQEIDDSKGLEELPLIHTKTIKTDKTNY